MHQIGRCPNVCLFVIVCCCLAGCDRWSKPEPIRAYTVKKHAAIQKPIETGTPITDPTDRVLAAIVLVGNDGWFFKAMAPIGTFPEDAAEQFDVLLTSLEFDGEDKPSWELGDRWEERPPSSSMRVADLMLGDLEFSVSRLSKNTTNERQYVLDNVSRWRRQIQLGPLNSAQLSNIAHKLKTADGHDVTVVDMLGKVDAKSMPPMAGQPPGRRAPRVSATPQDAGRQAPFTAKPPANWKQQKPGMMQLSNYLVQAGDQSAEVSVSVAGGDFLQNVIRWRRQIGLEPVKSEADIDIESLTVSGKQAKLVRLTGEQKSIVVSIVPHAGRDWFFKLMGDKTVVEQEAAAFTEFLSTVRIN